MIPDKAFFPDNKTFTHVELDTILDSLQVVIDQNQLNSDLGFIVNLHQKVWDIKRNSGFDMNIHAGKVYTS